MKALHAALERLKNGEREPALASLLDVWRTTRAPAIADAIDRLSAALTADVKPIGSKKEWEAAFTSARPAVFGRLLEALPSGLDRGARLKRLCELAPDPRVGTIARTWLADRPVSEAKRSTFFPELVGLLEHTRDIRLEPLVAQMTAPDQRSATIAHIGQKSWKALVAHAATLASTRAAPVDAAMLAEISALLGKAPAASSDPTALYAAVFANPADDEPRIVLSDLLQQKGDPRGEFIALQLAREGSNKAISAAERKLEKAWARDWLGAIEPSLLKAGVVFERGFVARGRYTGDFQDGDEWSTVTHLDLTQVSKFGKSSGRLLVSDKLRSLRHVTGMTPADIDGLGIMPWLTVGFVVWWSGNRFDYPFSKGPGKHFPAVTKLVVAQQERNELDIPERALPAMLDAWPKVDELEIDTTTSHLPALASRLRRLTIHTKGISFTIDRDAKELAVELRWFNQDDPAAILAVFNSLKGAVTRVTLGCEGKLTLAGDDLTHRYTTMSLTPLRAVVPVTVRGV